MSYYSRRSSSGTASGGSATGKPMSAKAAALLADLKANAPTTESNYIANLVESAAKRKLASELALERKIAREAEDEGAPSMKFVTRSYEEKIEQVEKETGQPASMKTYLRGAERVDASRQGGNRSDEKGMRATSTRSSVDADELIRRRDARRAARKAPPSRVTDEMIQQARERARQRLGIAT